MAHETGKFEAGKKPSPEKNNGKIDAAKKSADIDRKKHAGTQAESLADTSKSLAAKLIARMAKKPEDLADSNFKDYNYLYLKSHLNSGEVEEWMQQKKEEERGDSAENAALNKLFLEVLGLAAKKENKWIVEGFVAGKGEKPINVERYDDGMTEPGFSVSYGEEYVSSSGYYNSKTGESIFYDYIDITTAQLKKLHAKQKDVLVKVAGILKRGLKLPEPKYMVVDSKKDVGVDCTSTDGSGHPNHQKIPVNNLVKVIYTDPNNGKHYVIAKNNSGKEGQTQGWVDAQSLKPYDAAKFHPEICPFKKAFVKKDKDTKKLGGMNLRDAEKVIIGKVPLGVEMSILALESSNGKVRALVEFKDPKHKERVTTGFAAVEYLDVK